MSFRTLTIAVAAVAAAVIGFVFFTRFSAAWIVLARLTPHAASALLVAAAALGVGALAFKRANDDVADEFLLGVPLFGTLLAIVALAGLANAIAILAITLLAAAYGGLARWRAVAALVRTIDFRRIAILLPPVFIAFLGAISPVNTPDELAYKLAIPKQYLLAGRMLELPLSSASYFPSAVYMADLAALVLSGGIAAKLLHFLIYLVVLRVVYRFAGGVWPVAVIAWTPALAIIAGWAWAEWAMIGFVLLSLMRWHDFLESNRTADLVIASAALGVALASKYTALPWLAVFLPLAVVRAWPRSDRWRVLGTAALIVTACGAFFYLRNLAWTGSPIAPFLLPNPPSVVEYRSAAGGWHELLLGYDIFHEKLIDDSLGILLPVMVLLSPFALLMRTRRVVDAFVIGAVQLVILISIAPTARLIALAIVPLAILGTLALERASRALLAALAAVAFFAQLLLVAFLVVKAWNFLPYLVAAESEEAYLTRTRDFVKPYEWIHANTSPDAKLLLLGENRTFHLERRAVAGSNLDGPRVAAFLAQFHNEKELDRELRRQGVTHILVHRPWYFVGDHRSRSPTEKEYVLTVPPETHALLVRYTGAQARAVYRDDAYVLYELRAGR